MILDTSTIVDCATELNIPPGDYISLWHDLGDWQLDALKQAGLQPHHRLLDFGCGALRLGLSAIDYLYDDRYFGVDAFPPYIELGKRLADVAGLKKRFHLRVADDFSVDEFGVRFDYANAQSVFTHLSVEQCTACMRAMQSVMAPGGVFLFTYLVGVPTTQGMLYGGVQPMRRLAITEPDFFVDLGRQFGAKFEPFEVQHPTGQQVALFRYDARG